ncbi:MAG: RIP metalloprotease RseP [Wolinella sp.]
MSYIVSLLVFSFLIFFHELGHFLAARFFGVKVEVFSIGFGKKLYSRRFGDTEYALSAIPLGGYVKMKGQDDADPGSISYDTDSYNVKKPYQRLMILAAGPFANLLLAFLLYLFIALFGSQQLAPVIDEPRAGMAAERAGMRAGDEILAINDMKIQTWDEASTAIAESDGELKIDILRKEREFTLFITPTLGESRSVFGEEITKKMIGIRPIGEVREVRYSILDAFDRAFDETVESSKLIVLGIQKLLAGIVPSSEVGGVISIVQITSKASESGVVTLFLFTALISVNLGILNLLPIPALDGGHIIFVLYEMIVRRAPSLRAMTNFTFVGWAILLSLMIFGLYNDISRIIQGTMP